MRKEGLANLTLTEYTEGKQESWRERVTKLTCLCEGIAEKKQRESQKKTNIVKRYERQEVVENDDRKRHEKLSHVEKEEERSCHENEFISLQIKEKLD